MEQPERIRVNSALTPVRSSIDFINIDFSDLVSSLIIVNSLEKSILKSSQSKQSS
jgi:hypothetical protein